MLYTVKSEIFMGHLISFISWVNKIHEIKCQRIYLFPIHLAGFIENFFFTLLRRVAQDVTSWLLSWHKSYDFNAANFLCQSQ